MATAECSAAETSAVQTTTSVDRASEEEQDDSEEELGGGGTSRKARPAPLDIAAAQNANSIGPVTPNSATPKTARPRKYDTGKKIGHRRVDIEGQITYKKIQTTQIMGSIQLGISHAVGGLASKPERDVLMQDFAVVETTAFPNQGSSCTPAHHYTDFKFKTYAPVAFRYFRDLFSIQPDDFLLSMCMEPMRELTNPGASGSIFYVTADDEFIIKTVQHKEGEFLQKLLPGYYMNLNQNPRTLLPKFFGLYCYMFGGKNVRLIVMDNLLPSSIKIHQKYDLKGSTYKRKAAKHECKKPSPTYKDLDFMEHHPEGILLEAETYNALVKTIQRDCRVLASFKIMDYSLLVGIHNLDKAQKERREQRREASRLASDQSGGSVSRTEADGVSTASGAPGLARSRSINRQRLVAHSTGMEAIQADSEPIDEEDDFPPGGIPARNAKGERLFLYLGIIDILQSYRLKKKLEHTWKSMLHDGDTVSVHRPGFYAQRFQDFMAKTVFKKIPSLDLPEIKGLHRKFRTLVSSYIALKHSPSRKKSVTMRYRPGSLSEAAEERDAAGVTLDFAGPSGSVGRGASKRSGSSSNRTDGTHSKISANSPLGSSSLEMTLPFTNNVKPSVAAASNVDSSPTSSASPSRVSSTVTEFSTVKMKAVPHVSPSPCLLTSTSQSISTQPAKAKAKVPPPVPPRSPRKVHKHNSASVSQSDIPTFSTPPPSFEEALQDDDDLKISSKVRSSTDPTPPSSIQSIITTIDMRGSVTSEHSAVISISPIQMKAESLLSTHSESSSTTSSGFSSFVKPCTWTPPHSVEGSTPTHTEGTPSFTESSSSGDLGCPTTPIKSLTTVKEHGSANNSGLKSYQETEIVSDSELFDVRSLPTKFAFTLVAPCMLVAVVWALAHVYDVGPFLLSAFN